MSVKKKKERIPKLPTGSKPIGPVLPVEGIMPDPVLGIGMVCLIIYVDFVNKKKIGHIKG